MKAELEKQLVEKYPKIFKDYKGDPRQTCMAFGFECGDGWYWLIDSLCKNLQWNTDHNGYPQVIAVQVKEKFGGLRFYTNGTNDKQGAVISFVESLSYKICENCGTNQDVSTDNKGWIRTLCVNCRKEVQVRTYEIQADLEDEEENERNCI